MTGRGPVPAVAGQLPASMSETAFQRLVIDTARWCRWRVVHYRPARVGDRWVTAVQGDVGGPDLLLARCHQVLLVELKSNRGRLGKGQPEWAEAIGPDLYRLWRPRDWPAAYAELSASPRWRGER